MADVTITVKTTRKLKLPTLPNFIRDTADAVVDIAELTEDQLREIGKEWTEAMVRKMRERRSQATIAVNREIERSAK